jgi:hypothetical protein
VGSAATLLAVGGHCLAGDEPPTWTTAVSLALLVGSVSLWLSGVRWTLPRLLALLVATQAGMHTAFVLARPLAADDQLVASLAGHTAHAAHAGHAAHAAALEQHLARHAEGLFPSGPMVVGHLAAAVVTALLLWRGEQWLGGVLDALALRAYRVLGSVTLLDGPAPQPVPVRAEVVPLRRVATRPWSQRGPPCE